MSEILSRLNKEQQEAVATLNGPVLIIAGAGSGKTKALTHRIAFLIENGVRPENILALTFTNKAAEEMAKRVYQLIGSKVYQFKTNEPTNRKTIPALFMGTFHSFGAKILRQEIHHAGYSKNFVIYDANDTLSVIKEIMTSMAINTDQFKPAGIYATISKQKNELIDAQKYSEKAMVRQAHHPEQSRGAEFYQKVAAQVFERYQNYLAEANALDFDDLLLVAVKIFKDKPEVLDKYQNQFKYILVDEYQDTNHAQYTLLKLLAQKYKNLCVVGDDWQSIYAFRGADFKNILSFEKDYPEAKIVFLEENYRSTQNILDAAGAIIEKNIYKTQKNLRTQRGRGEKIKIIQTANEVEEGIFVTQEIKKILARESNVARDLNDFVILYRTNAQSRAIEEAVMREGWLYRMVGAVKFYERREVKDIIAYLRFIQNSKDLVSLKRIINVPARGIGKTTLNQILALADFREIKNEKVQNFVGLINEFKIKSQEKKVADLIKLLLEKINYKNYCIDGTDEGEARWENIMELITVASKFNSQEPEESLSNFLEEIALTTSADEISDSGGMINLMTLHSAKGLEFPVVFIIGAEEGLIPHSRSSFDMAQMEEERRLCYVGLTRAKEKAYLVFTRRRSIYGRTEPSLPSRFLGDIPAHLVDYKEYEFGEDILDI